MVAALTAVAAAEDSATVVHDASAHPLSWTLRYAKSHSEYIRRTVRDYSCRLVKRERIDGQLQEHHFARVLVRCQQSHDGVVTQPMSVFMQFLAPSEIRDRRVLYIEGKNRGKALVRKGGDAFKYLRLRIDPRGTAAQRESNYPITEIGFDKIIERLVERVEENIRHDPQGTNTQVTQFRNASVNDRICTHIRVVHPDRSKGIEFHTASLYIDDELHVPIRLVVHGWPVREGQPPPLMEEYTYVDLRLNVGLTDADFSEAKLDSSSTSPQRTAAKVAVD
jgi:hypothetical protein